jgi:hypothetical protein
VEILYPNTKAKQPEAVVHSMAKNVINKALMSSSMGLRKLEF